MLGKTEASYGRAASAKTNGMAGERDTKSSFQIRHEYRDDHEDANQMESEPFIWNLGSFVGDSALYNVLASGGLGVSPLTTTTFMGKANNMLHACKYTTHVAIAMFIHQLIFQGANTCSCSKSTRVQGTRLRPGLCHGDVVVPPVPSKPNVGYVNLCCQMPPTFRQGRQCPIPEAYPHNM